MAFMKSESDNFILNKWWAKFDSVFQIPTTIGESHAKIHDGYSFHAGAVDIVMATAATMSLAFKTPAGTKRAHMWIGFITLTGGHVELVEGPVWTNQSGTPHAIYNRKREATATMGTSMLLEDQGQASFVASDNMIFSPTAVTGGEVIETQYAFGEKNFFSGEARDIREFILKPDTPYNVKFTSDAASNKVQLMLDWYEHRDAS